MRKVKLHKELVEHLKRSEKSEGKLHRESKYKLYNWLNNADKPKQVSRFAQFEWKEDDKAVYVELPFYLGCSPVYFHESAPFVSMNINPLIFIPDIIIFSDNIPTYLIEVVASNPLTEEKMNRISRFFSKSGYPIPAVFTVEAQYLYGLHEPPKYLEGLELVYNEFKGENNV